MKLYAPILSADITNCALGSKIKKIRKQDGIFIILVFVWLGLLVLSVLVQGFKPSVPGMLGKYCIVSDSRNICKYSSA